MMILTEDKEDTDWGDLAGNLRRLVGEDEFSAAEPRLRRCWLAWRPLLRELRFSVRDCPEPLLALWLEAAAEEAVDLEWKTSPGDSFLLDSLAAELCMSELRRRLPGENIACAPLPTATPGLLAALREAGLADGAHPDDAAAPILTRRYAVLTYERARGCAACALRAGCPKLRK